jgi:rRNA maturation RNase YbeY
MEGRDPGSVTFIYCSDVYLREINRKYLKTNSITDVISFEYNEDGIVSGDIFISVDRVRENASYYKIPLQTELRRVMVHGLLHLIGYRDKTDKDKSAMTEKEDLYLSLHSQ